MMVKASPGVDTSFQLDTEDNSVITSAIVAEEVGRLI